MRVGCPCSTKSPGRASRSSLFQAWGVTIPPGGIRPRRHRAAPPLRGVAPYCWLGALPEGGLSLELYLPSLPPAWLRPRYHEAGDGEPFPATARGLRTAGSGDGEPRSPGASVPDSIAHPRAGRRRIHPHAIGALFASDGP